MTDHPATSNSIKVSPICSLAPLVAPAIAVLSLVLGPTSAAARSAQERLGQVPLESLRITSQYCDLVAAKGHRDPPMTKACALIQTTLLQHGFNSNVEALHRWQRSAPRITFARANPMAWKTLALACEAPGPDASTQTLNGNEACGSGWTARRSFAANSIATGQKNAMFGHPSPLHYNARGATQSARAAAD